MRRNDEDFLTQSSATSTNPTGFEPSPMPLVFIPTDDGVYTVVVIVSTNDGRTGVASVRYVLGNAAPTPAIGVPSGTLLEGTELLFRAIPAISGGTLDPGTADELSFAWTVNGSPVVADPTDPSLLRYTPSDNSSYTIGLTVTDDDGGTTTVSKVVSVVNVAPSLQVFNAAAASGSTISVRAVATDPAAGDLPTISWLLTYTGGTISDTGDTFTFSSALPGPLVLTAGFTRDKGLRPLGFGR